MSRLRRIPARPGIAADEDAVLARFAACFDLEGARVLEIGGAVTPPEDVAAWISVDPRISQPGPTRLAIGAEALPFDDAAFDLVFSSNAFQHVAGVERMLAEAARVLRPGGFVYAHFGPVWSAPDGSHIEDLVYEGRRYDFWETSLLPDWSHLVFEEAELREILAEVHDPGFAAAIARWVHHSEWINRRTIVDWRRMIAESPLDAAAFGSADAFGYDHCPPRIAHPRLSEPELSRRLAARYGLDDEDRRRRDLELVLAR